MNRARTSTPDLSGAQWRSSSYSGGNNECVEIADNVPAVIPVRDSKRPAGPVIAVAPQAWGAFIARLG
ncbi:DUF397 domain-containing protein [Streptomyces sp. ME02-8801-2C]|uniref:DUF397 domain-containing protein n=1 Tax=Streptomyces sp. ME02-8801-2C TaxID=3028680 RepID=UPI0029A9704F|nr:DUF397 domain-containing protein [Streptomyces sp. ME02-8801-2C]MDX3453596.1 DUF397 domain-containing protein [Streptomyces sp. ME02-8801-2C]